MGTRRRWDAKWDIPSIFMVVALMVHFDGFSGPPDHPEDFARGFEEMDGHQLSHGGRVSHNTGHDSAAATNSHPASPSSQVLMQLPPPVLEHSKK